MGIIWKHHFEPAYIICCVYMYTVFAIGCEITRTTSPLLHHRCISNGSEVIFINAKQPQCEWKCLSIESCRYVNINPSNVSCELGVGRCANVVPSPGHMVKVFTLANRMCHLWSSDEQVGREPVVVSYGTVRLHVSRIHRDGAAIVGKLAVNSGQFWANIKGQGIDVPSGSEVEVLTVDDACTWIWLPYTSGEALPVGAVIGGHLGSGSPIYVAKMVDHQYGKLAIGYYSTEIDLGNYELHGAKTTTTMDILVMLWMWSKIMHEFLLNNYSVTLNAGVHFVI